MLYKGYSKNKFQFIIINSHTILSNELFDPTYIISHPQLLKTAQFVQQKPNTSNHALVMYMAVGISADCKMNPVVCFLNIRNV